MIKPLLLVSFLAAAAVLTAQITVTDATFPATGDTLKTATDLMPGGIEITPAGGPYTWDYSGLNAMVTSQSVFLDASQGMSAALVPTATHVVIDELIGSEAYFRVTSDKVEFIAASGADPVGFGVDAIFRFTPPIVQRRAPMTFPANNTSTSNLLIGFAWSDLPGILTDSLNLPLTPDSIRVRVTSNRNDFIDAYGNLTIPGGSYDVLREKRTQINETRVDILIPFLGWQDVTDLLAGGFQDLGVDTTITYEFFSNEAKEIIASVEVDPADETTVTSVTFKDNGLVNASPESAISQATVKVIPNPVKEEARFELDFLPAGSYILKITDLEGRLVRYRELEISGYQVERISFHELPAGNYIYQLTNRKGQGMASGWIAKL